MTTSKDLLLRKRIRVLSRDKGKIRSELETPAGLTADEYGKLLGKRAACGWPCFSLEIMDGRTYVVEEHRILRSR